MSLLYPIKEEDHATWLQKLWQYRLQFELMMPAAMIFISGGMKMGWAVYELPSAQYDYNINLIFLTISWFIGVIFGVCMASFFVGSVSKNIPHILSGFLLLIGGIVFIIFRATFIAIAGSCIAEGTAFGLIQLQAFVTGPEVANKNIRGLVMATERCFIWFGVLLQLSFTHSWYKFESVAGHTMHVDQMHGIVITCLGLATILWSLQLQVESPVLLLKQQRDEGAIFILKKLQGTNATYTELMRMREDFWQLLSVDADDCCWYIFRKHNMLPLFKLSILRCFVALSMSQPFNHIFLSASWLGFDCDMNCLYTLCLAGFLGSLLGALLIDRYGRRKLCVVTLLPATIFMFTAGGVVYHISQPELAITQSELEFIAALLLLYQFVVSTGISITATVYLSEAFTVTQKPVCIAVVLITENLMQILMTMISGKVTVGATVLFFILGGMCLQLGLYVFFCMPETKHLTLYECLLKFKGVSLRK